MPPSSRLGMMLQLPVLVILVGCCVVAQGMLYCRIRLADFPLIFFSLAIRSFESGTLDGYYYYYYFFQQEI